jgi:hypothetical protein
MAAYYRDQVSQLRDALNGNNHAEAVVLIRKLIDRIVLTPVEDEHGHKVIRSKICAHNCPPQSFTQFFGRKGSEIVYGLFGGFHVGIGRSERVVEGQRPGWHPCLQAGALRPTAATVSHTPMKCPCLKSLAEL